MVVCGVVIIKGNDMFDDEEFLFINIKDLAVLLLSLSLDEVDDDNADAVVDGVEDNGRFSATGDKVSFDVAVFMDII